MLVATTSLGFMGKNPISQMEIKAGDSNPIFYLICLQNMLMQHLSCSIMLCHVTKKKYSPFNNKLLLFILVAIFAIYCLDKLSDGNLNMPYCIYTLLAATLVCQCHFIVVLIQEMCDALGIKAF